MCQHNNGIVKRSVRANTINASEKTQGRYTNGRQKQACPVNLQNRGSR